MTKVWCAETECEFCDENLCTAEEINLSAGRMHTVHEGYRHVWTCRKFQLSDKARELFMMLKSYFDKVDGFETTKEDKGNA